MFIGQLAWAIDVNEDNTPPPHTHTHHRVGDGKTGRAEFGGAVVVGLGIVQSSDEDLVHLVIGRLEQGIIPNPQTTTQRGEERLSTEQGKYPYH